MYFQYTSDHKTNIKVIKSGIHKYVDTKQLEKIIMQCVKKTLLNSANKTAFCLQISLLCEIRHIQLTTAFKTAPDPLQLGL